MSRLLIFLLLLPACTHNTNTIPILLTTPGEPTTAEIGGMVVPVEYNDTPGVLAIDTGSALTFLYTGTQSPEYTPHAGAVTIGNERLDLPGRNFEDEDKNIVGVLGAAFFIGKTTLFVPPGDAGGGTITRYHEGTKLPDTTGWTTIPFENVEGHIIVTITIDGQPRRLMWDTGSPHILLIGEQGRPGDEESRAMDVEGTQFPMFMGPSQVTIGNEPPITRTILRAPSFPYFEGTVESLGGNIHGLAGQSTFGLRSILFTPHTRQLHVQPPQ